MKKDLTLRYVRSSAIDKMLYRLSFGELNPIQARATLKIAILFLNSDVQELRDFGYRILLKFSNKTNNFIPLYDVASQLGYVPIANLLKKGEHLPITDSFLHNFMASYRETFKQEQAYQTEKQKELFDTFQASKGETVAVVAPTSYGKSQLIEQTVENDTNSSIAIVVPSKALISQTRKRVLDKVATGHRRRVIVHHDMQFDPTQPVIAVVTQERLLRLFQRHPEIAFDILFVDEAHNLLSGDKRSRLLASAIIVSKIRNPRVAIKYLTPFLVSPDSLMTVTNSDAIKELTIQEKLKTEDYYICDLNKDGKLRFYDQFLNKFEYVPGRKFDTDASILMANKNKKNIVFLNKPKDIEFFAEELSINTKRRSTPEIEKICAEIAEYVHPKYRILNCLRKGVAYHHGAIPDTIRSYIENAFKRQAAISWIVTNSTLLEGVNIPADALFILDNRKGRSNLTAPQFRNLVGRINRFSEVFNPETGTPQLLVPSIYVIASKFTKSNANIEKYLQQVAKIDAKIKDEIANPLLAGTEESEEVLAERDIDLNYIENIEPNASRRPESRLATSEAGRLCFIHNIFEFDIIENESLLDSQVRQIVKSEQKVENAEELMELIVDLFVSKISEDSDFENLLRLKHQPTRGFYAMFFGWRINQINYKRMIASFMKYWKKILEENTDTLVFAGRWGDIARNGHIKNYIDLKELDEYEMVNLAIVRIKEEQDFVDNNLVKFLEVINDLGLVEKDLYNSVKYGTTDNDQIHLIRSGFTHIAANVLATDYKKFVDISEDGNVSISNSIKKAFSLRNERELVTFEVLSSGLLNESA